jgi:hypothetical protein
MNYLMEQLHSIKDYKPFIPGKIQTYSYNQMVEDIPHSLFTNIPTSFAQKRYLDSEKEDVNGRAKTPGTSFLSEEEVNGRAETPGTPPSLENDNSGQVGASGISSEFDEVQVSLNNPPDLQTTSRAGAPGVIQLQGAASQGGGRRTPEIFADSDIEQEIDREEEEEDSNSDDENNRDNGNNGNDRNGDKDGNNEEDEEDDQESSEGVGRSKRAMKRKRRREKEKMIKEIKRRKVADFNYKKAVNSMEYFGKLSEKYLRDQAGKGKKRCRLEEQYLEDMVDSDSEEFEEIYNNQEEEDLILEGEDEEENRQRCVEDGRDGWEGTITEAFAKNEVFDEEYFPRPGVRKDGSLLPAKFLEPSDRYPIVSKAKRNVNSDQAKNERF